MSRQYHKQFPKITSRKVSWAAGLRDREQPSQLGAMLSEKAIKDISLRILLVSQLEDGLSAICWVAHRLLKHSYRRIAKYVPLSPGRIGDRIRSVDQWLNVIVPKESQDEYL